MQDSRLIKRINVMLTKRIIAGLVQMAKKDEKKYEKFYKEYSTFIKEGMCTDFQHKDELAKLIRFDSSTHDSQRSLDEYIATMPTSQNNVNKKK